MANFSKSGDLVNDADHVARDLEFFEHFAKRDALWFWIYLCWNHGLNVPVWNLTSLPEGESLDLGGEERDETGVGETVVGSSSGFSSKKNKKRGRNEDDDAFTTSVTGLVEVSRRALDHLFSSHSTATVAHHHYPPGSQTSPSSSQHTNILSPQKKRAADLCAFKEQLSELVEMKKMLPDGMQGAVDSCISKVTRQVHDLVCVTVEDLTA